MLEVVGGQADTEEKLKAIAFFDGELFIKPWLKAIPCVAHFIAELANLRKVLVANLYSFPEVRLWVLSSCLCSGLNLCFSHSHSQVTNPRHSPATRPCLSHSQATSPSLCLSSSHSQATSPCLSHSQASSPGLSPCLSHSPATSPSPRPSSFVDGPAYTCQWSPVGGPVNTCQWSSVSGSVDTCQ